MADVPTVQMRGLQGSRETVGLTAMGPPCGQGITRVQPLVHVTVDPTHPPDAQATGSWGCWGPERPHPLAG